MVEFLYWLSGPLGLTDLMAKRTFCLKGLLGRANLTAELISGLSGRLGLAFLSVSGLFVSTDFSAVEPIYLADFLNERTF